MYIILPHFQSGEATRINWVICIIEISVDFKPIYWAELIEVLLVIVKNHSDLTICEFEEKNADWNEIEYNLCQFLSTIVPKF